MSIKTLFTSIEQIKEYITVDISSDIRTILPYIKQAEKYIIDVIGRGLYNDLITVVHDGNDHEALKELLEKVRLPLANFGYMLAIAKLNVNVGDTGFTVTNTNSLVPASEWRVRDFRESVEQSGNDALEWLIFYLEENSHAFPQWMQSQAYSYQKRFFVNNAKEMNDSVFAEVKRIDFLKLVKFIHQTEQADILPVLGVRFFKKLKSEILAENISTNNQYVLTNYIRPALCYLTFNKFEADDNSRLEGVRYLEQLRIYLDTNAHLFPDYKLSSNYTDPAAAVDSINSEDSGIYVM